MDSVNSQLEHFSQNYLDLLNTRFSGLNLTAISDLDSFHSKQTMDSVLPFLLDDSLHKLISETKVVVDVGFGGGFPLLPLAVIYPEVQFLGIDARRKKADAVSEIAKTLNLNNVRPLHGRVEEFLFDIDALITFKAVAKISELLPDIQVYAKKLSALFYKGPNVRQLEEVNSSFKSWKFTSSKNYSLPNGDQRETLLYRVENVPHGTNNHKNLVKISTLL